MAFNSLQHSLRVVVEDQFKKFTEGVAISDVGSKHARGTFAPRLQFGRKPIGCGPSTLAKNFPDVDAGKKFGRAKPIPCSPLEIHVRGSLQQKICRPWKQQWSE